jgi:hypothetical protein
MFTTERICLQCKAEEKQAPGYAAALQADEAAIRAGNYNFPGIGPTDEDRSFFVELRAKRAVE